MSFALRIVPFLRYKVPAYEYVLLEAEKMCLIEDVTNNFIDQDESIDHDGVLHSVECRML